MLEASYYKKLEKGMVQCQLCPHSCTLENGEYGKCKTRVNQDGTLFTLSYGILSSISSDPVEKKPLYHFQPGRSILSLGSFGCNLSCDYCQNCEITQINESVFSKHPTRSPEDMVNKARLHRNNIGLAYTYNEPVVYYEYMIRCAELLQEHKLSNVMVTNGYINQAPLKDLIPLMDAFNVDLKSFRNLFYLKRSGASLHPVLNTIETIAKSGKHLELTFLIIPEFNDTEVEWMEMIHWITDHCPKHTVLHVSRYYPYYKVFKPPTPLTTIQKFLDMAREKLDYVFPGNTPQLESHSHCPSCSNLLVERFLYDATVCGLTEEGNCNQCNTKIQGIQIHPKT
jgi:pyruvate formate lyase activating enzyme